MKKLLIAEKPSVAREFANALGARWDSKNKYYYNDEYIISNSIGHLLSLDPVKMGFNDVHHTMITPSVDIYKPNIKVRHQLNLLKSLINKNEITSIISATDPDRAGELIFWNIYNYSGTKKPVERFWTSELLEKDLILNLLNNLEDSSVYYPYAEAERLRMYSDLVLGYNCSTAYALKKSKWGLSLGRVQSPVLMEIVSRYLKNTNHVADKSYNIEIKCKYGKSELILKSSRSFSSPINEVLINGPIKPVSTELTNNTKRSPELYNKASLMIDASSVYKIDAKDSSKILQDLYQTHKITSYPRTDSKYMDEKPSTIKSYFNSISNLGFKGDYSEFSKNKVTIFNNSKVKGHYALIILNADKANKIISSSNSQLSKILKLIKKRMLVRSTNPIDYDKVKLTFEIPLLIDGVEDTLTFTIDGSRINKDGWLIYDESKRSNYEYQVSLFQFDDSKLINPTPLIKESISKPSPLYNSGSIIKWMEDNNLGTPATIESYTSLLISRKYIQKEGKNLVPTSLGLNIYEDINDKLIGNPKNASFMDGIMNEVISSKNHSGFIDNKSKIDCIISEVFNNLSTIDKSKLIIEKPKTNNKCLCGSSDLTYSAYKFSNCNSCNRSIPPSILGVKLKENQTYLLLAGKHINMYNMTSKRTKKKFNAKVTINESGKMDFKFI